MLLFALVIACGPKVPPVPAGAAYAEAALVGTWKSDGGTVMIIEEQKGRAAVTSFVDYDGEVFEVRSSGWEGTTFGWSYHVPSTGFEVSERVLEATGAQLSTEWTNQTGDSGPDLWTRQ